MSEIATRFAPSPTGRLHLGHVWSALQAHDLAGANGGHFLLRIEDIDAGRARGEYVSAIIEDLLWLGLSWEGEIVFQSERIALYGLALEDLKRQGLAYPCFCTRRDIAISASAPHGPDGPLYPGTCRHMAPEERDRRMAQEPHCWRLDMAAAAERAGPLAWRTDAGITIPADPAIQGDVVLARKDSPVSYHLAVVVDDAAQGISHVVRGMDLFAATHVHRLLQHLLGLPSPIYRHHSLLADATGQRLAKRTGAPSLEALREGGMDPGALVAGMREGRFPEEYRLVDASSGSARTEHARHAPSPITEISRP